MDYSSLDRIVRGWLSKLFLPSENSRVTGGGGGGEGAGVD